MNKIFIVVIILVVVAAAGVIYYFSAAPKSYVSNNSPVVPTTTIPESASAAPAASTTEPIIQVVQVKEVIIKNFAFEPADLQVKAGTEVKWTNQDPMNHAITSTDFQSGQISNGQSYSHVFSATGSYDYHCSIHPSMNGKIIVNP